MNAELRRSHISDCGTIIGTLSIYDQKNLRYECKTLENYNKRIKPGNYVVVYDYSPKFDRDLYRVEGDPRRQGIRIHAGNRVKDTTGCILTGATATRDTEDKLMITHSVYSLNELHRITKGRTMELKIWEAYDNGKIYKN